MTSSPDSEHLRASLALSCVPGIGAVRFKELVERYGSASAAWQQTVADSDRSKALADADRILDDASRCRARLLVLGEVGYPGQLLDLHDPPPWLFCIGASSAVDLKLVAIVGTRHASVTGLRVAHRLAAGLARADVATVSGMARGIDTAVHWGSLEGGAATIAVLGCGVDVAYPAANAELREAIAQGGSLLSEAPCGSTPHPGAFPRRNRLIAALARAVVVVEAGERSGALITAELAAELGRPVGAVPGAVDSPRCRGSNRLLRDGAHVVLDYEDIVALLGSESGDAGSAGSLVDQLPSCSGLSPVDSSLQERVLGALAAGATETDAILEVSGLSPAELAMTLAVLEAAGTVCRDSSGAITLGMH